jgi:hypothetical protein
MAKRCGSVDLKDDTSSKKNSQKRCIELGIKIRSKDGKDEIQKLLRSYDDLEEKKIEELQKQGAAIGLYIKI